MNHLNQTYTEYSLASYSITNGFSTLIYVASYFPINTSTVLGNDSIIGLGSLFLILASIPALFSINAPGPKLNLTVVIYPLKFG